MNGQRYDIDFSIEEIKVVELEVADDTVDMEMEETFARYDVDEYEGPYSVSPTFENQTLETKEKFMTDNVEVDAIAVSHVTNPSGGKTVYIGGIFNA